MTEHVILGCGYHRPPRCRTPASDRRPGKLPQRAIPIGCVTSVQEDAKSFKIELMESNGVPAAAREAARGSSVLLSVPPIKGPRGLLDPTPRIVREFGDGPRRVVYLSTTGVYGSIKLVDETTLVAPVTDRQRLRIAAEEGRSGWAVAVDDSAAGGDLRPGGAEFTRRCNRAASGWREMGQTSFRGFTSMTCRQ